MRTAKVLFIGGAGLISSACVALAAEREVTATAVVRGRTTSRPLPVGVRRVVAGVADRIGQYVFISSTSVYSKPVTRLPIVESFPVRSLSWPYAQNKIACEDLLVQEFRTRDFPAVIVRPGHTYDHTAVPLLGDGTSLRPMTHARDFACGLVPPPGDGATIGDCFHITSDEAPNWEYAYTEMARAAGVAAPRLVHQTTDTIARLAPAWADYLRGDGASSMMFDNSKIKWAVPGFAATVGFSQGAREIVRWHDEDPTCCRVDPAVNELLGRLTSPGARHAVAS